MHHRTRVESEKRNMCELKPKPKSYPNADTKANAFPNDAARNPYTSVRKSRTTRLSESEGFG
jgi:hypothetical protein